MEQPKAENNELQLQISIVAAPAVSFIGANSAATFLPNPAEPATADGFRINLEGLLKYEAMSRILNGLLAGRRFEVSEGLIATYVIVQGAAVSADAAGNLLIRVQFSGSFGGTVYLKGKPVYDAATQTMHVTNMTYDLQSKSFLLNTAKWLLNNKIVDEVKKHTRFPLTQYFDLAKAALDSMLNKEWAKGISGEGMVGDLALDEVAAGPEYLNIKSHSDGRLVIKVSDLNFGKRR